MAQAESRAIEEQWQAWIEQQRELLNQPASADQPASAFKMGEELLSIWRGAWTSASSAQTGAAKGLSDLFAKLPPIGLAREQVAVWQELASIQAECQQLEQELREVLAGVQRKALDLLDEQVRQRRERNEPVATYRELYDLWVDCAEQVFAKVAHSDAYSKLQGELGNATIRLKARQQKVIEYALKQFDLPTRSELNSVHLQLRQLKQKVAALEQRTASATPAAAERPAASARPAKPAASTKPAARAARKSAVKKSPRKSR
ncbi:MAG TPA: poly(R)-hydroxyalkanoic acid synthase subunit PhaE [Povalibacter sp.]|nr:poly(R)-hydroxyalkanoic acid synthase subunit PhaE [Povalibacter sp.]